MLLVPSATRVERTDTGADDLLRRLAALLPDAWIVAGGVAAKPVSRTCDRGYTRPFDAIVLGDRFIFALDIWSQAGLIANRQKPALLSRIHDSSQRPDDCWQNFRRETEKLKALLQDRFAVEPGRVVPEKIWSRAQRFNSAEAAAAADSADLRSFARAATRLDRASSFAPLRKATVDRIATFLTEEAQAKPERSGPAPILLFTDGSPRPAVVGPTPAAPPTPAPFAPSEVVPRPTPPALDAARSEEAEAAEPAPAAPASLSRSPQSELLLQQVAPIARIATPEQVSRPCEPTGSEEAAEASVAPTRPPYPTQAEVPLSPPAPIAPSEGAFQPTSPALDAAPPRGAEEDETAPAAPARPSRSAQSELLLQQVAPVAPPAPIAAPKEVSQLPSPALNTARSEGAEAAEAAAAPTGPPRPTEAEVSLLPPAPIASPPTPITRFEEASRPVLATMAAAPAIAKAAEARSDRISSDRSLDPAAAFAASAPAQPRPTAHRKWLAVLLLLLVSQAATIAWLALSDRASPRLEPAPAAPAPAGPAPIASVPDPPAPIAEPFVVRSLATSKPMVVGSETVTLRAGPSPDFPAVGALDAGTEVVASASADGPGGSSWIEIAADGASGFVPDSMVQPGPVPDLAIEDTASRMQTPTPKIERAAIKDAATPKQKPVSRDKLASAEKKTPAAKIKRAPKPAQLSRAKATAAQPGVACILPGGKEIQTTHSDCRAQSGIIYQ